MDNEKKHEEEKKSKKESKSTPKKFLQNIPASIPYFGQVYSSVRNDLSHEKILDSLDDINNFG